MSWDFPSEPGSAAVVVHATAVAWRGRGLLIAGAAGSGKSALALELMARGCDLVADDRVELSPGALHIAMTCPAAIAGRIEARGIGILPAAAIPRADLRLVLALDRTAVARLPAKQTIRILGRDIPFLHKVETGYFPAAILQYLKGLPG